MKKGEIKLNNQNGIPHHKLTMGQKAADNITKWAGSWLFIMGFLAFLVIWMIFNAYVLVNYYEGNPFDPYPFILLNLVLSCLAAIQAPVILMSQNRETERDRLRSEYDYAVNRKAEREIKQIQQQLEKIHKHLTKKK